jgi:hypothetical protein
MSIDNCQKCDKRLDTDWTEYQADGSLLCDGCLDDIEREAIEAAFDAVYEQIDNRAAKREPDWKAIAGELAEAASRYRQAAYKATEMALDAALAKYEQEKGA